VGVLAGILAILGGLCGVMGIVTATGVVPLLGAELTWMFWLVLGAILFLACIAALIASGGYE